MTNQQKFECTILLLRAVADTVRLAGPAPSGVIYSALMGKISLEAYQTILGILKRQQLIEESDSHLLTWIGPVLSPVAQN